MLQDSRERADSEGTLASLREEITGPGGPGRRVDDERLAAWLREVARTRDFTREPPAVSFAIADRAVLQRFVDGLRNELLDYREIVDAAGESIERNARQLAGIVASTGEQTAVVERTAAAIAEIEQGATHVAETAHDLRATSGTVAASSRSYDAGIAGVLERLQALVGAVEATAGFAQTTERGRIGIQSFLERLRRIARQARLLGINAAIEAAHLGEAGRGFVIVADEVKRLSTSTVESANDVAGIEKQLHDAGDRVDGAIREAATIVRGLADALSSAQHRSAERADQVGELERAIGEVAGLVGEQSGALTLVNDSIRGIAEHAHEVSEAAERAAGLALSDGLANLRAALARTSLGTRTRHTNGVVDLSPVPGPVRQAAAELRDLVDGDERELLTSVARIAVAIARNSYEWRSIGSALGALGWLLDGTAHTIEDLAAGAGAAAAATQRMRDAIDAIRAGFGTAIQELQAALDRVAQVRDAVQRAATSVSATSEAGQRAGAILDLIDAISSETTLLSFNAAIEAAHAGEAGSGFGVIADEIRALATGTSHAVGEIGEMLGALLSAGESMREATGEALERTAEVERHATAVQDAVGALRGELQGTLARAAEVAAIVEQQLGALTDVRSATAIARERVESETVAAADEQRLELAMLGMRAHALAARRPLGTVAEAVREIALAVASDMDEVFEDAIRRGAIRLDDCFDTDYVELTGERIRHLARLFDVSRVPASGFDPPKYETRYDAAIEGGINAAIDAAVPTHRSIVAMFGVDLNGFCFGHYRECRQDWTGDRATDLAGNRIKRFFDDPLSLRCSRVGLGGAAHSLPRRTPYATFRENGCTLVRGGLRPWAVYTYARDTGIVYNDVCVGIFARDQRVGTLRVIYDADSV